MALNSQTRMFNAVSWSVIVALALLHIYPGYMVEFGKFEVDLHQIN